MRITWKNFQCNGHCLEITAGIFYDFMISDDFKAVKSSHILEAHPKNF